MTVSNILGLSVENKEDSDRFESYKAGGSEKHKNLYLKPLAQPEP